MCWSAGIGGGHLSGGGPPPLAILWTPVAISRSLAAVWTLLALTQLTGVVEGKARYLSRYPIAEDYVDTEVLDPDLPDFDADVKMPGRYFPKLPYAKPYLEEVPNEPYDHHHRQNPHQRYQHHHHFRQQPPSSSSQLPQGSQQQRQRTPYAITTTSDHHHHHHHHHNNHQHQHTHHHPQRQQETFESPMKRRSSSQNGGYAFRVGEESGQRRVIAVRGSDAAATTKDDHDENFFDAPQEDATLGPPPGPSFDRNLPRNITIQAGKTAVLSCRVFNVNDKSVSWIRQDDLHILTVDKYKYSTDQRVSVVFNEPNLEWVLRIRGVTPADAGRYECQVSTKPVLSFVVNMRVVVPRAWVLNAPEIFVHRGSPINLTCVVTHGTERPVFIYWYHHDKVIDYEGRGGVTVNTQTGRDTVSHLLVREAGPGDSGKYTCSPSNGEDASVNLHVLNGEYQAAMQTNRGARLDDTRCSTLLLLLMVLLLQAAVFTHLS